jgi:lysyl-tRNA synthetase class 2
MRSQPLRPIDPSTSLAPVHALRGVPPPRARGLPRLIAAAVALAGIVTLVSAAFAPARVRIEILTDALPLTVRTGAASVAALAGVGMLVIAGALARRQRRAWATGLVLLVVAGISHLLKGLDVPEAGLNLGLAVVLVMARHEFDARPGTGSLRRAMLALPALAFVVWGFGWIAILAHADGIRPHPSTGKAALSALRGAIGLPLGIRVVGETGKWIPGVLPLLGVIVVVLALVAAFRPAVERSRRSPTDIDRARDIVRRYGTDTLAYFALREDKNYFFEGDAVVSYRYLWNLGLVSGDPVGHPADAPRAIEGFVRHARTRGWGVAVLAGGEEMQPIYTRLGLRAFYLGDEAIVDTRTFGLDGRQIRKVRQSCHRLERLGYRLEFLRDGDVSPDLRDALGAVARSWRGRAPERGFTMALGREPSDLDPDCMTIVARDDAGRAQAYLHLVPCCGPEPGYSLDQMRRRPGTPNGLIEWMVARTAQELGRRGVARFSLNFAFLGGLFRSTDLSLPQRLEVAFARRLNPFFQIESLHEFNAKFAPNWVPRYIYYEAPLSFPRVALAYLEAEAYLRLPLIGARAKLRMRGGPDVKAARSALGSPPTGDSER